VSAALDQGVKYLTIYSFSTENWRRPKEEVDCIFKILADNIESEAAAMHKNGVRVRHIGNLEVLSPSLQESIKRACDLTQYNQRLILNIAFNYGGRAEILEAARKAISLHINAADLDEKSFTANLTTSGIPDVDLLIRTGGELRISNFLLWQSAYAELYFTGVLWPDFTPARFARALEAFAGRKRRYGGLG
jgi:undecaprenyl diphosphate synthase